MIHKLLSVFSLTAVLFSLQGTEISDKKIEKITQIVRGEFRKIPSPIRPKKSWQIYKDPKDAKIKNNILAIVRKKVTPFETKVKQVGVPPKVRAEISKKVARRFPYKTAGDIAKGAIAESKNEYPLVKKGDDVTVSYYRGGIFSKVSGKVQSVRDGGRVYEVGNQLIKLSEIPKDDRKYFDPDLNEELRQKFMVYYQKNFAKIKRDYENYLLSEELEKVTVNEKNGYIFFKHRWMTAKQVAEQLYTYYRGVAERRFAVEKQYVIKDGKSSGGKKKK